jgi:hypothetical protein
MLPQKNDDVNVEYNHTTYKKKLNQIVQSKKHSQTIWPNFQDILEITRIHLHRYLSK